jgi:tetratricopeptide (TPR) repeat protein
MTQTNDVVQLLNNALALHQSGRLAEAEQGYRQALAVHPDHPDGLHLLGVLYHQAGYPQQALPLLQRAAQLAPTPANLGNLGEILRVVGRPREAVEMHKRSLALNPDSPDTNGNLGLALMDLGEYDQAEKAFDRACKLAPQRADMWVRLCRARDRSGDPYGAISAGRKALELQPDWPEAMSYLALALSSAKKHDEALQWAQRAVAAMPDRPETHLNLGLILAAMQRHPEAEAEYLKAVELNPKFAPAHRSLAALRDQTNQVLPAIQSARELLSLVPADMEAWVNLSGLYRRNRDYENALSTADSALKLAPSNPGAHGARGFALLHMGDYKRGFAEYEWRWQCDNFTTPMRDMAGSAWNGTDPAGRTILVHPEQGFGDTIQFARYIPMLVDRGATVVVETWAQLKTLMATVKGVSKVIVSGVRPPPYDLHVALLSLPKIFGTTLETIPQEVPYFHPESARLAWWKDRIESAGPGLKVGLVWAGNAKPDPLRTCPISELAALSSTQGVTFISLQNRANPRGAEPPPQGLKLVDVSDDLKDFHETAAAMMNLDLIITIDTATAHLAGAMGRPTWTMLPWACDWRWLDEREDSVWYPTMRLFRQSSDGVWSPVTARIAQELERFVADRSK